MSFTHNLLHDYNVAPGTQAPTNVMAVQMGLTRIRVSWTPSSDATGYIISYTGGSSSESVTVSGGSTYNYLLTDLQNGDIYTISIVAKSDGLNSESVIVMNVQLGKLVAVPCT